MSIGRFLISRDATGAFRWVLRDGEGGTLAESTEGFTERKECVASLDRLRKVCAKAELVDLTMPATVIKPKGKKAGGKARPSKKAARQKGKR